MTATAATGPWFLALDYDPGNMANLIRILHDYFELANRQVHCEGPDCRVV